MTKDTKASPDADHLLRVATLPLDTIWGDKEANLDMAGKALSKLEAGVDIVVLPELFTTGFECDPSVLADLAEGIDGPTMQHLRQWCAQHDQALAGSFVSRGPLPGLETQKDASGRERYFNRGFFVEPSGKATFYDKRHLFCLSQESSAFTRGMQKPPIIPFRGWNVSMVICYDTRFPAWCRNFGQQYDLLVVPANWPESRGYAWKHLLVARAIENQAAVVGANRSGRDDYGDYTDLSFIFDAMGCSVGADKLPPDGQISSVLQPPQPDSAIKGSDRPLYATLSLQALAKFRRRLPVKDDADDYTLVL